MVLTPFDLERLRAAAVGRVESVVELAQRICAVPAPTGSELERAELVAALWRERGYTPEIDDLGNVYVTRRGRHEGRAQVMLLAHIDTVFPADTPLAIVRDGDIVRGPGIGDNSLSVAAMLMAFELLDELGIQTETNTIAVADVGEEGLGNLRGARTAVERYREQLGAVLVVDGRLGSIVNAAVGSKRWRVLVQGPGGHSFGSFGTPSAVHGLGRIIVGLADMQVPSEPKTTFNVGVIEGGTSVNTIAPTATALLDLRSTDVGELERLAEQARTIITQRVGAGLNVGIEVLGERPAGQRSEDDPLVQLAAQALDWLGIEPEYASSSTDANIPISMSIPAVCVGITHGEKAHTLDEYIHVTPIRAGLAQLLRLIVEASALIGL